METDREEKAAPPASGPDEGGPSARTQRMYDEIVAGLKEYRIVPGTRLREEKLAGLFEVSRTQVRKVLLRLEHEGLVRREPHRGVTVVAPDLDETREIFEARRLIEPWLVTRLCAHCSRKGLSGLRRIVRDEQRAHKAGDRRTAVRLSGEFHRALAQAAGNRALAKSMDELTLRTCLAILANTAPILSTCRDDEHGSIIEAIERGDSRTAARLMVNHLDHIESSLEVPATPVPTDALEAAFAEMGAATVSPRRRKAPA
ncbi:MAG: GntR family transcriptional regulator [Burkholderiales bacterium]